MEISLEDIKKRVRSVKYMEGIDQSDPKVKKFGMFFTPSNQSIDAVDVMFQKDPSLFKDPNKTIIDPVGCGSGDLLCEAMIKKMENGSSHEQALKSIYGVDIDDKNVKLCRDRLLCGAEHLRHIVETNIVRANSLKYSFLFNGTDPEKSNQEVMHDKWFS